MILRGAGITLREGGSLGLRQFGFLLRWGGWVIFPRFPLERVGMIRGLSRYLLRGRLLVAGVRQNLEPILVRTRG